MCSAWSWFFMLSHWSCSWPEPHSSHTAPRRQSSSPSEVPWAAASFLWTRGAQWWAPRSWAQFCVKAARQVLGKFLYPKGMAARHLCPKKVNENSIVNYVMNQLVQLPNRQDQSRIMLGVYFLWYEQRIRGIKMFNLWHLLSAFRMPSGHCFHHGKAIWLAWCWWAVPAPIQSALCLWRL